MSTQHLYPYPSSNVTREMRQQLNGHRSVLLWFTGLSGAGKSTLAHAIEAQLYGLGYRSIVLDGDNVRLGLCSDLGFTEADRKENIRRIAETAKLMLEAGVIVMSAFISPFREDRLKARGLFPHGDFIEIYCATPLDICEQRDVKGLYKKAREGEVKHFTGISSPYEPPLNPELMVDTGTLPLAACVRIVMDELVRRGIVAPYTPPC